MRSSLLLVVIPPDFHDIEDLMAIADVLHQQGIIGQTAEFYHEF